MFNFAGVPELNRHVCYCDWEFTRDNMGVGKLERENEIGKCDTFYDQTYKRIIDPQNDVILE